MKPHEMPIIKPLFPAKQGLALTMYPQSWPVITMAALIILSALTFISCFVSSVDILPGSRLLVGLPWSIFDIIRNGFFTLCSYVESLVNF
jgi:hypothetical protein